MKESHFLTKNVFWGNAVGYLRNGECQSFQIFAIVFSTPENLLIGISGALGMKESHFLSKNVLWETAVGYLRNSECYSFQTFAIVFSTPENLLIGISGALGMKESHFLTKMCFEETAVGYLRNGECWSFQTFAHCVQHLRKLTSRDLWSSRNESRPPSKEKCVLRKCCGVSQKWWMLELSNLCHCVQHPWKLTNRDFWSSRNESRPICKENICFQKTAVGYLRNGECRGFQTFAIVFSTPENLLVKITETIQMKESHFVSKHVFSRKCCGVS